MLDTIIVIPCYNEEHRLDRVAIQSFVEANPSTGLLLVIDGSTDKTQETLESIERIRPGSIEIPRLAENSGKAEAVRQGFRKSFPANPRYLGFWDADLATPLQAVREFQDVLDTRSNFQMVFGSRVQLLGRMIKRSALRHYFSRIFATLVSWKTGLPIYDSQCGAKLFKVSPELISVFEDPFLNRWIFDVEIIMRFIGLAKISDSLKIENLIYEHPLEKWQDVRGSKITPVAVLRSLLDLYLIPSKHRTHSS